MRLIRIYIIIIIKTDDIIIKTVHSLMYIPLYTNYRRLAKYMQESEINKNRRFKKI